MAAEEVAAEETGASLVAASVVASAWLLAGAGAEEAAAGGLAVVCAAVEDGAGAVEDASWLPADGSVARPHLAPAALRVLP